MDKKQVDIEDWCKIVDVNGYKMIIEVYWSTDDDDELHHMFAIKISSRFSGGDCSVIEFLTHDDGTDYTTKEAIAAFNAISKQDLELILSEWFKNLSDPDRMMKKDTLT